MNERIPVFFSTDHNYIMQTGVCILSLLESANGAKYDINILISGDVTETDQELISKQVGHFKGHDLNFRKHGDEFSKSFVIRGISTTAYYRLLIPWMFPQYDKVIYSDVDVIFNCSLESLFNTDLKDNFYAAVPAIRLRKLKRGRDHCKHVGLNLDKYHNSGFLLINCSLQRQVDLRQKILELSSKRFTYQDQDIMNTVGFDRILSLPGKYCILPFFFNMYFKNDPDLSKYYGDREQIEEYVKGRNCIMHYGGPKPWDIYVYGHDFWWETYRKSIFYDPTFDVRHSHDIISQKMTYKIIFKNLFRKLLRLK